MLLLVGPKKKGRVDRGKIYQTDVVRCVIWIIIRYFWCHSTFGWYEGLQDHCCHQQGCWCPHFPSRWLWSCRRSVWRRPWNHGKALDNLYSDTLTTFFRFINVHIYTHSIHIHSLRVPSSLSHFSHPRPIYSGYAVINASYESIVWR